MDYTYFKVLDTDNNIVFECVNDDIYSQVYYNDTWWKLLDLTTHFLDNKFQIVREQPKLDPYHLR